MRAALGGLHAVDLRALVWAGLAIFPLYAWFVVDGLRGAIDDGYSAVDIVLTYVPYIAGLAVDAVGSVVVAIVGAHMLQGRRPVRPFSFSITAFCVALFIVALDALYSTFTLVSASLERVLEPDAVTFEVVASVLRASGGLLAVALATRLYVRWREPTPSGPEAMVLSGLALCLAVAVLLDHVLVSFKMTGSHPTENSIPLAMTGWLQFVSWTVITYAGIVFLFGSFAIAWLKRMQAERHVVWGAAAGLAAAVIFYVVYYGPSAIQSFTAGLAPSTYASLNYISLLTTIAAGLGGGIAYAIAVDPESVRKSIPASINTLRTWPQRPSEDEER
jgi:hypothetical protein